MTHPEQTLAHRGGTSADRDEAAPELDRMNALLRRVLLPHQASGRGTDRLLGVRRAVGVLTIVGTLVQVVVWLMIAVFSRSVDTPWWLFTTVAGGAAAISLWVVDEYGIQKTTADARSQK